MEPITLKLDKEELEYLVEWLGDLPSGNKPIFKLFDQLDDALDEQEEKELTKKHNEMMKFDSMMVRDLDHKIMMPVLEHFLSLNGEGLDSGKPSMFIRLVGCNLRCQYDDKTKRCDTPEGLAFPACRKTKDYTYMSAEELGEIILDSKVKRICLTGGEPLAREGIAEFIKDLDRYINPGNTDDVKIEIETNGSIDIMKTFEKIKAPSSVTTTMDYKSLSSGENDKMIMENWKHLEEDDTIKFVVSNREEMEDAVQKIRQYKPKANLIFSPMFGKIDLKEMWEFIYSPNVIDLDIKAQVQLHKIVYDPNQRGV